jgi:hypothetical protein
MLFQFLTLVSCLCKMVDNEGYITSLFQTISSEKKVLIVKRELER